MGVIKAVTTAAGGILTGRWLEVTEPDGMGDRTVFVRGIQVRRGKGSNTKGSSDIVSDDSVIHVYPNQFMMLVDGGRIMGCTAEEDYYKVNHPSMPSMFSERFGETLKESFNRIRLGGVIPGAQRVYYVNLQKTKRIKFGTRNPMNYFDSFYNAELFLRIHGTYSIKITNPIRFYAEAIPRNADHMEIGSISGQYLLEFLKALQISINQMPANDTKISYVTSRSRELGQYMAHTLDEERTRTKGMEIQVTGIANIIYGEESQNLTNPRNRGAMIGDPSIRGDYTQTITAEGLKNTKSNDGGAMVGFMGMGIGMQIGSGLASAVFNTNTQQMQMDQASVSQSMGGQSFDSQWATSSQMAGAQPGDGRTTGQMPGTQPPRVQLCPGCGASNTDELCGEYGHRRPDAPWTCVYGNVSTGRSCNECGKPRP